MDYLEAARLCLKTDTARPRPKTASRSNAAQRRCRANGRSSDNSAFEIHNLTADAVERKNFAMQGSKREELLKELLNRLDETGAPLAADPNPKPVPGKKSKEVGKLLSREPIAITICLRLAQTVETGAGIKGQVRGSGAGIRLWEPVGGGTKRSAAFQNPACDRRGPA